MGRLRYVCNLGPFQIPPLSSLPSSSLSLCRIKGGVDSRGIDPLHGVCIPQSMIIDWPTFVSGVTPDFLTNSTSEHCLGITTSGRCFRNQEPIIAVLDLTRLNLFLPDSSSILKRSCVQKERSQGQIFVSENRKSKKWVRLG